MGRLLGSVSQLALEHRRWTKTLDWIPKTMIEPQYHFLLIE
ncbi:hypothetical protein OHAE_4154 [Ochrobactrum soli]|uniref:Uncharacterized protein n=1 Tax=Ochrobactrum soli TaxID=2448455 RepID=A0A2P9HBA7_9HYPH|nr:hypothetical protein OHAE_4154 [[Ochrobactrum] soli]